MIDEVVDSARFVLVTAPVRGAKTPLNILGAAPDLDQGNCRFPGEVCDPRSIVVVSACGLAAGSC